MCTVVGIKNYLHDNISFNYRRLKIISQTNNYIPNHIYIIKKPTTKAM